ncbi:hypothetical protein ABZV78_19045 [Micromonospora sp. NPDC004540]|uniref:hypothetical protein n=1 Tax=Micromonospora sp. NPDC004540 TaxID=3154457 RepID=UPI0033A4B6AC
MSLRKRVWIAVACASVGSLMLGLLGCLGALALLLPDSPKHAREYLSQVQVDPAYRRVGVGGQGNCNCNLEYIYVGPSRIEPRQVFSGPALTLQPTDGSFAVWDRLLEGEGASEASGQCRVVVYRYQRDREPHDEWNLTELPADERALVASGRLAVLSLYASCERDYG